MEQRSLKNHKNLLYKYIDSDQMPECGVQVKSAPNLPLDNALDKIRYEVSENVGVSDIKIVMLIDRD